MRPYCQCEYCTQDRLRRATAQPVPQAEPVTVFAEPLLTVVVATAIIIGLLASWWMP